MGGRYAVTMMTTYVLQLICDVPLVGGPGQPCHTGLHMGRTISIPPSCRAGSIMRPIGRGESIHLGPQVYCGRPCEGWWGGPYMVVPPVAQPSAHPFQSHHFADATVAN